ncbi:uncharacterized protein LOC5519278 [Nematostella vectensis]|uniref:uncharacterized protein LOC5519278 n=1 Tax=Nematostella vectensis TaxID=45351 RepID=UPI00207705BA|nr:uncharacterized protein LOC5519278 [Nematostella vectensis]
MALVFLQVMAIIAMLNITLLQFSTVLGLLSMQYAEIGCYGDSGESPRPLSELLHNYRENMTWNDINDVIKKCASLAHARGYKLFGVHNYGECRAGADNADQTYARNGVSVSCLRGVGRADGVLVYRLYETHEKDEGCKSGWHSTTSRCIYLMPNATYPESTAERCRLLGGTFFLATSSGDFTMADRLIRTLDEKHRLNSTKVIVLGKGAYKGILPLWETYNSTLGPPPLSSGDYVCALKHGALTWYVLACNYQDGSVMCQRERDLPLLNGGFAKAKHDAVVEGSVFAWYFVDDVMRCARECLLVKGCHSFNYEYNPSNAAFGAKCELNDVKLPKAVMKPRDSYNIYERL